MRDRILRQQVWAKYKAVELNPGPEVKDDPRAGGLHPLPPQHLLPRVQLVSDGRRRRVGRRPQGRMRAVQGIRIADASAMPLLATAARWAAALTEVIGALTWARVTASRLAPAPLRRSCTRGRGTGLW